MSRKASQFVALMDRLRWIKRWGLKRNVSEENVMEHSWQVASLAHLLCLLHNQSSPTPLDSGQVVLAALYHDASEIITGDLPTPIKYHNPQIRQAYQAIEDQAEQELLSHLPQELHADFRPLLLSRELPAEVKGLIKAADLLSALIKCQHEVQAGNQEFKDALQSISSRLAALDLPALSRFRQLFDIDSQQTLDQQIAQGGESLTKVLHEHDRQVRRAPLDTEKPSSP